MATMNKSFRVGFARHYLGKGKANHIRCLLYMQHTILKRNSASRFHNSTSSSSAVIRAISHGPRIGFPIFTICGSFHAHFIAFISRGCSFRGLELLRRYIGCEYRAKHTRSSPCSSRYGQVPTVSYYGNNRTLRSTEYHLCPEFSNRSFIHRISHFFGLFFGEIYSRTTMLFINRHHL